MLYDYSTDSTGNAVIVDKFSGKPIPIGEQEIIFALMKMQDEKEKKKNENCHADTVQ